MSKHINTGTEFNPDPIEPFKPTINKNYKVGDAILELFEQTDKAIQKRKQEKKKTETEIIIDELLKEYDKVVDELEAYYKSLTPKKPMQNKTKDVIIKVPESVSKITILLDRE